MFSYYRWIFLCYLISLWSLHAFFILIYVKLCFVVYQLFSFISTRFYSFTTVFNGFVLISKRFSTIFMDYQCFSRLLLQQHAAAGCCCKLLLWAAAAGSWLLGRLQAAAAVCWAGCWAGCCRLQAAAAAADCSCSYFGDPTIWGGGLASCKPHSYIT